MMAFIFLCLHATLLVLHTSVDDLQIRFRMQYFCAKARSLQISPFKLAGQLALVITENKRARLGHSCQAVNWKDNVKGSS
jgi:hypothetical protein